ncbi:MAG: hypothetical protein QOD77_1891 [Thermoplasmata archaeon]|jgi:hypothetical protein|nr:hypothetical protein [Thermoplasmata archaeon]
MRGLLPALAVLLGLLALPAPGASQAEAMYNVDGIDYYYAAGTHASGHFAVGADAASQVQEPFSGCGWAKLRPDLNKGRIQALGNWGTVPLTIDVGEFAPANRTPDSIAADTLVPAAASGFSQTLPATMMATTIDATVRLGPAPILDPVTGADAFQATWFVTQRGFRDDATGAIQAAGDADAWEMHLRVGSPAGASRQGPASWSHAEPADGTPYLVREEAHSRVHAIPNERLFGKATLSARSESMAPAGSTALAFTVYAPDGAALGNFTLAPALNAPAAATLEVPLDQFGDYYVEVHGPAVLATYEMTFAQAAPEAFVLDLWWDDVQPGYAGLQARNECNELIDGAVMTANVEPRPPPVAFDWKSSLFTVAAGLTLLVVVVTLTVAAYQMVAARRAVQG